MGFEIDKDFITQIISLKPEMYNKVRVGARYYKFIGDERVEGKVINKITKHRIVVRFPTPKDTA